MRVRQTFLRVCTCAFLLFFCSRCVFLRKALQLFPRFKSKAACSWKYGTSGIRAVQILRLAIELKGETRHETKRVEVAAPCSRELLNVRRRTGELARGTRRKKYSRKPDARILIRNTSERRIFTLSRVAPNPCRGARKRKPCVCTALYIPRFIALFFSLYRGSFERNVVPEQTLPPSVCRR